MASRAFNTRTLEQDQRAIRRDIAAFTSGMEPDKIPKNVTAGAVSNLVNARVRNGAIEGREGTELITTLELPSILSGVGGTRVEDTLTFTSAHGLTSDAIGYKCNTHGDESLFISSVIDDVTVTVGGFDDESTGEVIYGDINVRGEINSSLYTEIGKYTIMHIGAKLYIRYGLVMSWYEVFVSGAPLTNSRSAIYEEGDNVVLVAESGIYLLSDETDHIVQINQKLPTHNVDASGVLTSSANPSAYNYIYGYSSIYGSNTDNRRAEDSSMVLETPGYNNSAEMPISTDPVHSSDGNGQDYTTFVSNTPAHKGHGYMMEFAETNYAAYVELSEDEETPYVSFVSDGVQYIAYPSFSASTSLSDVAEAIDISIKSLDATLSARLTTHNGETGILFYNLNGTEISFNSSGNGLDLTVAHIGPTSVEVEMGNKVNYLRPPIDNYSITHYSVYRTKDIFPSVIDYSDPTDPRTQNNQDTFALIDDVPLCTPTMISVDTEGNIASDSITTKDVGSPIYFNSLGPYYIDADLKIENYVDGAYEGACAVASSRYGEVFVSSGECTITSAGTLVEFTQGDIGKVLFTEDGKSSIIVAVGSSSVCYLSGLGSYTGPVCLDPVARGFYDETNDVAQNSFLASDPHNMRFYNVLPGSSVSLKSGGLLLTSDSYSSIINYTGTQRIYRAGYTRTGSQFIDTLTSDAVSIKRVMDYISIFTGQTTYSINIKQATVNTTDFGESYITLPQITKVSGSIGVTSQMAIDEFDSGGAIVITSEPAIREFNGMQYGADITDGLINKSKLQKLNTNMLISSDYGYGITVWGYDDTQDT